MRTGILLVFKINTLCEPVMRESDLDSLNWK